MTLSEFFSSYPTFYLYHQAHTYFADFHHQEIYSSWTPIYLTLIITSFPPWLLVQKRFKETFWVFFCWFVCFASVISVRCLINWLLKLLSKMSGHYTEVHRRKGKTSQISSALDISHVIWGSGGIKGPSCMCAQVEKNYNSQ